MLLRFIKNWTLPLAMLAGTAGYFFFARVPSVSYTHLDVYKRQFLAFGLCAVCDVLLQSAFHTVLPSIDVFAVQLE